YLTGAIDDWPALFRQAYRCTAPGGWVESCELDPEFVSDDGTLAGVDAMLTWGKIYREAGKKLNRSFMVIEDDCQRSGIEAAGFKDIRVANYKVGVYGRLMK